MVFIHQGLNRQRLLHVKKRSPPKEPIYEVPYKDETPYENASHKSSLVKPRVLKLSPNEYGFKYPRLQDRSEDV